MSPPLAQGQDGSSRLSPSGQAPASSLVRVATQDDVFALRELARKEGLSFDPSEEIARTHGKVLVLETDEGIVGFCSAWRLVDATEIRDLAVAQLARRKGYARKLVQQMLSFARREGMQRVMLEVSKNNHAALSLYQQLGFEKVGQRPRYYPDGSDAWLMDRFLEKSG